MRKVIDEQMRFGQIDISQIEIDPRCRDEIPQMLRGLQHIYCTPGIRKEVFKILEEEVVQNGVDISNGRPGMHLWQILVLGVLRVNCNSDWDRIHYLANQAKNLRQMLGLDGWLDETTFSLQSLKDNASLLKPETLEKINVLVIREGHKLVKKKEEEELRGRCDSFVLETNVHYPTDINLLLDAMRKVIFLVTVLAVRVGVPGWRKFSFNFKTIKGLFRTCQKMKHSTSKDERKKEERESLIQEAFSQYLTVSEDFLKRARETVVKARSGGDNFVLEIAEIEGYMLHAERQIDQIRRRVLNGETIRHDEKVFSIFEEHTEWISKGKAGVPVELGLRVCILEDQYGFILQHRVMEKEEDVDVAVPMVKNALVNFPELTGCSFDKGFWNPLNREELEECLDHLVLPKKGKLSESDKDREYSDEFRYYRRRHSAVESAVNAVENHGLDRCPDHGIEGFRRYVSLAVLGRNIQQLGALFRKEELRKLKRKKSAKCGKLKNAA